MNHAVIKTLIVAGIAVFAIVLWAFASHGAECESYDRVLSAEQHVGADVHSIPGDLLPKVIEDVETITGLPLDQVTRGFMVIDGNVITFGFEMGGCLMPAIHFAGPDEVGA